MFWVFSKFNIFQKINRYDKVLVSTPSTRQSRLSASNEIMKSSRYCLLFFLPQIFGKSKDDSLQRSEKRSLIPEAIVGILRIYYAKNSPNVDVIYYGEKFGYSDKLCSEILRRNPEKLAINVKKGGKDKPWMNQLNTSSVLLFDSDSNFKKHNISWLSHKHLRHKHLVIAPEININDVMKMYDGFSIDNVNFLVTQSDKSIDIITSFMYSPFACRSPKFTRINSLNSKTLKWDRRFFFVNKYRCLYGCHLRMFAEDQIKATNTVGANIVKTFAKLVGSQVSVLTPNHIKTGYNVSHIDLYAQHTSWSLAFKNEKTSSYPYFIDNWVFFIPSGEFYTPLEKVLMPFQPEVWIAIVTTFLFHVVAIQLMKLFPAYFQEFTFGSNIRTPTVNFLSTFLTGVQLKIPTRSFARLMLMNCIVWCLIIRTCYQSELYKFLQKDLRKPEAQTILEMIEQNFTFLDDGYVMKFINETADKHGLQRSFL